MNVWGSEQWRFSLVSSQLSKLLTAACLSVVLYKVLPPQRSVWRQHRYSWSDFRCWTCGAAQSARGLFVTEWPAPPGGGARSHFITHSWFLWFYFMNNSAHRWVPPSEQTGYQTWVSDLGIRPVENFKLNSEFGMNMSTINTKYSTNIILI